MLLVSMETVWLPHSSNGRWKPHTGNLCRVESTPHFAVKKKKGLVALRRISVCLFVRAAEDTCHVLLQKSGLWLTLPWTTLCLCACMVMPSEFNLCYSGQKLSAQNSPISTGFYIMLSTITTTEVFYKIISLGLHTGRMIWILDGNMNE